MLKTLNNASLNRYFILNILLIVVFSTLFIKFFQLQIIQNSRYIKKANINSIKAERTHSPRGFVLDKNRNLLIDNKSAYVLTALPHLISNIDSIFTVISELITVDAAILKKNYRKNFIGKFIPVRVLRGLSIEQISLLEEHRQDLPGIEYKQIHERNFPSEINGSHFLGYVVNVDQKNIRNIPDAKFYNIGDIIGWDGIEKSYEQYLRDTKGVTYKTVDAFGRVIGQIPNKQNILPVPGEDLILTIDSKLQKFVEDLMVNRRGCAIVGNPQSGEIICYVNSPSHPPDLFSGITPIDEWNNILNDPEKPLLNRIANGLYPPGSTLKMIIHTYILENNIWHPNKTIYCSGKYKFGRRYFGCWKPSGHGNVNFDKALIESCDVYFYKVIQDIPIDEWADLCRKFGFGNKTGVDLPSESRGIVPDEEYLNNRYGKNKWTAGLKLNLSIGQGETLVTPLQLLTYINLIYTNGYTKTPHFVNSDKVQPVELNDISQNTWNRINQLLYKVVNSTRGTGKLANPKIEGLEVAGKTGTAENPHGVPHAWFVGYAQQFDNAHSFVMLLENAGHGGEEAAPLVSAILKFIYTNSDSTNATNI